MKKVIAAIAALLLGLFALCGCGGDVAGGASDAPDPVISEESIESNIKEFLGVAADNPDGDLGNRTPLSVSELYAAKRIRGKYSDEEKFETRFLPFDVTAQNKNYSSQNIEVRLKADSAKTKQVIIGACYDNGYGTLGENDLKDGKDAAAEVFTASSSLGAYESGTSVATLMSIIDYYADKYEEIQNRDFSLVFVFFGAANYNNAGANEYSDKTMNATDRLNTLAYFDIGSMGGETLYMYADESETEHEKFVFDAAQSSQISISTLPDNMPIIDGIYLEDVYYAHYGMFGNQGPFMQKNIPCVRLFSGAFGGFNLSPLEVSGEKNISGTNGDTFAALESSRSAYKKQGSAVASLIMNTVKKEGFAAAMESSRASKADYTAFTKPLWAYLTVIFAVIALCVALIFIVRHFEKKYPFVPQIKRMKIAVFGMDYEDKNDSDIFIDLKNSGPKNPFDGY